MGLYFFFLPSYAFCLYLFVAALITRSLFLRSFAAHQMLWRHWFCRFFLAVHLFFCWCRAWTASMLTRVVIDPLHLRAKSREEKALAFIHSPHVLAQCSGVLCRLPSEPLSLVIPHDTFTFYHNMKSNRNRCISFGCLLRAVRYFFNVTYYQWRQF